MHCLKISSSCGVWSGISIAAMLLAQTTVILFNRDLKTVVTRASTNKFLNQDGTCFELEEDAIRFIDEIAGYFKKLI
jgi:hypothetical protein